MAWQAADYRAAIYKAKKMKRDIKRLISEYDRKNYDVFFIDDIRQVKDIADNADYYDIIHKALKAGFVIGTRYAKRNKKAYGGNHTRTDHGRNTTKD